MEIANKKEIYINPPYITLGQFLKYIGFVSMGTEAKMFLENNKILINKEPENRRGKKLYLNDIIQINEDVFVIKFSDAKESN